MGLFTRKREIRIQQRDLGDLHHDFSKSWLAAASITNDCKQDGNGWWIFYFTTEEFELWKSNMGVAKESK